jgi:uncharacterized protein
MIQAQVRIENGIYHGSEDRPSAFDLVIPAHFNGKLVVFVHGYKGFKDWGAWNMVQFEFLYHGFGFAKFNLSHNGGTADQPVDFPDLEAFSRNTYSKEIDDIHFFLDHLNGLELPDHTLHLIGHSRGGGDVLIAASEREDVRSVTTWAGISTISGRLPHGEALENWKQNGVRFEKNSRTNQDMPVRFDLVEDVLHNAARLNIEKACRKLSVPRLVLHGECDEAVALSEGRDLANWLHVPLIEIPGANHTFGAVHPWTSFELPEHLEMAVTLTRNFIGDLNP